MKFVLLFTLWAVATASPKKGVDFPPEELVVITEERKNTAANEDFQVAQYTAYQFNLAQQRGYTPSQVSEYLQEQGFPEAIAEYFALEYKIGLTQNYFQSPYQMFRYYYKQGFNIEAHQYIAQQIAQAFEQYQNYLIQYGEQAYEQEYPGVPQPIAQYIVMQCKYYGQYGVSYSEAQYAQQQLTLAENHSQYVLQWFANEVAFEESNQYLIEQLQQGVHYAQNTEALSQVYHQGYITYYAAQYYIQQAQQVYQYFQNAYNYVQQHAYQVDMPQYLLHQVENAYLAAKRALDTYQNAQNETYNITLNINNGKVWKIMQHIQTAQHYLQTQDDFSYAPYIFQQLNQAQQALKTVTILSRQGYFNQPITNYAQQQFQLAQHCLTSAHATAQQQGQHAIAQQLQMALQAAQYNDQTGEIVRNVQEQLVPEKLDFILQQLEEAQQNLKHVQRYVEEQTNMPRYVKDQMQQLPSYQYNQGYQQRQANQHMNNVMQFVKQQTAEGTITEQQAAYIEQQMKSALQSQQQQQQQQYLRKVVEYIHKEPVPQYVSQNVHNAFKVLQFYPTYQGSWTQKHMNELLYPTGTVTPFNKYIQQTFQGTITPQHAYLLNNQLEQAQQNQQQQSVKEVLDYVHEQVFLQYVAYINQQKWKALQTQAQRYWISHTLMGQSQYMTYGAFQGRLGQIAAFAA